MKPTERPVIPRARHNRSARQWPRLPTGGAKQWKLLPLALAALLPCTTAPAVEITITEDGDKRPVVTLENEKMQVVYRHFTENGNAQTAILDLVVKGAKEDHVKKYLDACATCGKLEHAEVVDSSEDHKTVRLEWGKSKGNAGGKGKKKGKGRGKGKGDDKFVSEVTIFKGKPYLKIEYQLYGVNIVDFGYPGGKGGVYAVHGAEGWKRPYVDYPLIYFDRYPADVGLENITEIDKPGSLDYKGWFVMGVFNEGNGRGFGRVAPVDDIDIIKLIFHKGFELFAHMGRRHKTFTCYLFIIEGGGADEALATGRAIVGQATKGRDRPEWVPWDFMSEFQ